MENKTFGGAKKISIIIPIFNEENNIGALHQEIKKTCEENSYLYEIIMVDDGSTDNTAKVALTLRPLKLIRFRKNFGQTAAMDAGIKAAKHDYLVMMDGDGQNDPADIPKMLRHLEENGFDAVSGWRKKRRDSLGKRIASLGADWLRKFLINDGVHDSGCTLKIYKKECFNQVNLYGEMHRFIPALLRTKGYKIGEIAVNHRPRTNGQTKYNWKRMLKGLIDLIAVWFWGKFASRPLHLLGSIGILSFFLGALASVYTLYLYLAGQDLSDTDWPLIAIFFLTMGVQLFILGLLADILVKNYYESAQNKQYYHIKDVIENK